MELDFWLCVLEITQKSERSPHEAKKFLHSQAEGRDSKRAFRESGTSIQAMRTLSYFTQ